MFTAPRLLETVLQSLNQLLFFRRGQPRFRMQHQIVNRRHQVFYTTFPPKCEKGLSKKTWTALSF